MEGIVSKNNLQRMENMAEKIVTFCIQPGWISASSFSRFCPLHFQLQKWRAKGRGREDGRSA